jgi:hypothetical protein
MPSRYRETHGSREHQKKDHHERKESGDRHHNVNSQSTMARKYSLAPESDEDEAEIVITFSNDEEEEGYKAVDINNGEQRIRVLRTRLPMLLRVFIFAIVLTLLHLWIFGVVKWLRPYEYKKAQSVYDLVIYRATPAGRFVLSGTILT